MSWLCPCRESGLLLIPLAKKLKARAILESASFKQGRARYSLILVDEAFRVVQEGDEVALYLARVAPGLPVPASGIGFLGCDFAARCDTLTLACKPDGIGVPESESIVGHVYLIFDHYTDTIHAVGLNYAEHSVDLSARMQDISRRLSDLDFSHLKPLSERVPFTVVSDEAIQIPGGFRQLGPPGCISREPGAAAGRAGFHPPHCGDQAEG